MRETINMCVDESGKLWNNHILTIQNKVLFELFYKIILKY